MAGFKELNVWQIGKELAVSIYILFKKMFLGSGLAIWLFLKGFSIANRKSAIANPIGLLPVLLKQILVYGIRSEGLPPVFRAIPAQLNSLRLRMYYIHLPASLQ